MQPHLYQSEPNLIAETYRNHIIQIPRRFEKHYDFLDITHDGVFILGTSNLTGRIWSGSLWVFNDMSVPPDVEKCLAGIEFDCGIPVGKWFDNGLKIILGTDSGAIHVLSLTTMTDSQKHYLSSLAIVSEHDDNVTAIESTTDNNKILSASVDQSIKIWDIECFTCEKTYDNAHAHIVTSAHYQPGKENIFVSTSIDGTSLLWDTNLEKPASLLMRTESGFTASCWINDNCIALGANNGNVSLVDLRMKSELDRHFCSRRPIYNMAYNKDKELLGVCADDPIVRIYNCSQNLLQKVYDCDRHEDFVRGLAWHNDKLYSCGWDSKILLHECESNMDSCSLNDLEGVKALKLESPPKNH